jgi:hypothetical protein
MMNQHLRKQENNHQVGNVKHKGDEGENGDLGMDSKCLEQKEIKKM